MKISIIGTSNTLMQGGYVDGLQASSDIEVRSRLGVGESTGLLFWLFCNRSEIEDVDCCLLDFAVNEQLYSETSDLKLDIIEDYIRGACRFCWNAGCLPILLALPRQRMREKTVDVCRMYKRISDDLHVPWFDGIDYVNRLATASSVETSSLFIDDGHLHPSIASGMGRDLAASLIKIGGRPWKHMAQAWSAHDYLAYELRGQDDHPGWVWRSTALMKRRFVCIGPGDQFQVGVGDDVEVVGLYCNLMHSTGILAVKSDADVLIDFGNVYASETPGLIMSVQALPEPLQSGHAFFELGVIERDNLLEQLPRRILPHGWLGSRGDKVEIGGLVLRSRLPHRVATRPAPILDGDAALRVGISSGSSAVDSRSANP